jgi:hypothetical protein
MIKGNKGEWIEIYVLLKLLGDGKIYAADENIKKIEDVYFPILKILRAEDKAAKYEYAIEESEKKIKVYLNGAEIAEYDSAKFATEAKGLFSIITKAGGEATFSADRTEAFIRKIGCSKLKARQLKRILWLSGNLTSRCKFMTRARGINQRAVS